MNSLILTYQRIYIYIGASEQGGGGRGVSDPPIQKYGGGAKYVLPPPMKCVLINFIYIKSSILSLLRVKFCLKNVTKHMGGGLYAI